MDTSGEHDQKSRFDFSRTSFQSSTFGDYDDDDPISAYFKQRLAKDKENQEKFRRSDSGSSLGIIDVDNISLLGDAERNSIENRKKFSSVSSFDVDDLKTVVKADGKRYDDFVFKRPETPKNEESVSKSELNLMKQRELAQKALKQVSNKSRESSCKSFDGNSADGDESVISLTSTLKSSMSLDKNPKCEEKRKGNSKHWFEANQSPQTPKYFIDELSSLTPEEASMRLSKSGMKLQPKSLSQSYPTLENISKQELLKNFTESKGINLAELGFGSEAFESQKPSKWNPEEGDILKRFEEDERKFIAEQSALSHNSEISQFSGVMGVESEWPTTASNFQNEEINEPKLSIGQFFGLRSHSLSSLVGPHSESDCLSNSVSFEQKLPSSNSSEISSTSSNEDLAMKKRCMSTYNLKPSVEPTFNRRHSNESCESNSTITIQNLLAGMESGLSGTQIYDQLMKSSFKNKLSTTKENDENKSVKNKPSSDTPKTSKTTKLARPDLGKILDENPLDGSLKMFKKLNNCQKSTPIAQRLKSNKQLPQSKAINFDTDGDSSSKNQNVLSLKNEKVKNTKFHSSTPKMDDTKTKKKTRIVDKLATEENNWQPLRVSCVRPTNLNKSEDQDGTLVQSNTPNSSGCSSGKQETICLSDTITIEDTVTAGDLTILSQRIDEMKEDNDSKVNSSDTEPSLLKIVQELANLPKGSVDCSALTPLLRDQYPELLSIPLKNIDFNSSLQYAKGFPSMQDLLVFEKDSWIKLCSKRGYNDKIYACAEVKKTVYIPLVNLTKKWLLVSFQSVDIKHQAGRFLSGIKENDEWIVNEFLIVSTKDALVPPDGQQQLKVVVLPRVPTTLDIRIKLLLKDLLNSNSQSTELYIRVHAVNPVSGISILPKGPINYGAIPEQCCDERTITLTYSGPCDLPIQIFIKEEEYQSQFVLGRNATLNGKPLSEDAWQDDKLMYTFEENKKHVLDFSVLFQPRALPAIKNLSKIDLKSLLIIKVDVSSNSNSLLSQIPISGTVGYAKFLCDPSCSPLVFQTPITGQPVVRLFPLKNVGAIPLEFSVRIICDDTKQEQSDGLFIAPKTVYLPKNDETVMNIAFTGNTKETHTKRLLTMQMKPNGEVLYDVELIGIIKNAFDIKSVKSTKSSKSTKSTSSRCLSPTGSATTSVYSTDAVPIRLLTTTNAISWPSVTLENEVKQCVQIKNGSSVKTSARISFRKDTNAFKILNDDGEKIQRLKKTLKPGTPITLTIIFRPDAVGVHHNAIHIETNSASKQKMISLNGFGGSPNIVITNTKTDLNGQKMIKLHNPSAENQRFSNALEFTNHGNVPGFVWIKPNMKVLSLLKWMTVKPSKFVVHPNANVIVEISQKLKNDDVKLLLSGKDIGKVSTLSIISGDEPSRLRLRRLVGRKVHPTDVIHNVTGQFENELDIDVRMCDDEAVFEDVFLKSLKIEEVAVVVKRFSSFDEPTILEEDETCDNFVTICNAFDTIIAATDDHEDESEQNLYSTSKIKANDSYTSSSSSKSDFAMKHSKKIAKWLESIEDPTSNS